MGQFLCDLGASVSLIPYSHCKRLNLWDPKLTTVTLQMEDRSFKRPIGVLDDILAMIDQCYVSRGFVILDIEDTIVAIIH